MPGKISGHKRLIPAQPTHPAGATSRVVGPERRNSTSYWAIASLALVVLLAAISLAGCRQARSQDDPRTLPPLVDIATVHCPDASQRAFTGVVVARVQSNLGFRVGGKIVERMVNTGDFVRRGQPLMWIDRNDLALAIAARNAAVASARARAIQTANDEARYATLLRAGVTTPQIYDQAKAAADAARAELHQAQAEASVIDALRLHALYHLIGITTSSPKQDMERNRLGPADLSTTSMPRLKSFLRDGI